jgi:hypothetical protein
LIISVFLPLLATTGKLRGNEGALVRNKALIHHWKSNTTNNSVFDFWKLPRESKRTTIVFGLNLDASFRTNFIWQSGKTNREIVMVCGKIFDNVPKSNWTFYLKYPAHAVGYSDGTVGLIPVTEFTNLNFGGFVSAASLATNSELDIFKN